MSSPAEIVTRFISEYYDWNVQSNTQCKRHANGGRSSQKAIANAAKKYAKIINRFCADAVEPQPISFGDDSMHSPDGEEIRSIDIDAEIAVVRTKHVGLYNLETDYEYHLRKTGRKWNIESVLLIDEDGKHECL